MEGFQSMTIYLSGGPVLRSPSGTLKGGRGERRSKKTGHLELGQGREEGGSHN